MSRRTRPPNQRIHPRLRAATEIARSVPGEGDALLESERLDVYTMALEFHLLTVAILPRGVRGTLRDQLERARATVVLNTSEGAGRVWTAERAGRYAIARAAAAECAALVDALRNGGHIAGETAGRARSLIVRIVRMLTRVGHRVGDAAAPGWPSRRPGTGEGR